MSKQRLIRVALVPLAALVLLAVLAISIGGPSTPVLAAEAKPDQQQASGRMPITGTVPMTNTMPTMMNQMMQMMQQMQAMMEQGMGVMGSTPMTGTRPMHPSYVGARMGMMGRMMEMMGMMQEMMQPCTAPMTGQLPMLRGAMPMSGTMPMAAQDMPRMMRMMGMMMQMMGHMQETMEAGMPRMMGATPMSGTTPTGGRMGMMDMGPTQEMMGQMAQMMQQMMAPCQAMLESGMSVTTTMPMSGAMPMGQGVQPGMMQMMRQMMQMMSMMQGTISDTLLMTNTVPVSGATGAGLPDLTQVAQAGAMEITVTAANMWDAEAATLDFTVELNSHSEEIDIDLAKTASLRIGDDEVTPVAWETASPKGHHVTGVLRFDRSGENNEARFSEATEFSLIIGGLPGDTESTFRWQINPQ